jgi:aminoglycoside phosphotransferase (APT) family kinase protein
MRDIAPASRRDAFTALSGGRTNLVWRFAANGEDLVLKLYRKDDGNPVFANDPAREAACLTALAGTGLAPRLRATGRSDGIAWAVHGFVPGQRWSADPAIVAALLSRLHRVPPPSGLPTVCGGSAALARQTARILGQCHGAMRHRLEAMSPSGAVPPVDNPVLIHGDPVPGNILVDADSAVLIDWQCPARGDPAEDLGLFLSPAMQMLYRGTVPGAAETERFLSACTDRQAVARYRALKPWLHWRMAAYCLWQSQRGAGDYRAGIDLEMAAQSVAV